MTILLTKGNEHKFVYIYFFFLKILLHENSLPRADAGVGCVIGLSRWTAEEHTESLMVDRVKTIQLRTTTPQNRQNWENSRALPLETSHTNERSVVLKHNQIVWKQCRFKKRRGCRGDISIKLECRASTNKFGFWISYWLFSWLIDLEQQFQRAQIGIFNLFQRLLSVMFPCFSNVTTVNIMEPLSCKK